MFIAFFLYILMLKMFQIQLIIYERVGIVTYFKQMFSVKLDLTSTF